MPADEIAGLSVVVSAEVVQAIKALEGMSRQFEDTAMVAQQGVDSQQKGFEDVGHNLKDDAEAHEKHSTLIQDGLKAGGKAWAAMGTAVTGAMYGIIRTSSYGELYMTRFSSIMQQAADTVMTRYGLVGALDDGLNAFQALVSGSKDGIETTKDAIRWWLEASGVLKALTTLMASGLLITIGLAIIKIVAMAKASATLVTAFAIVKAVVIAVGATIGAIVATIGAVPLIILAAVVATIAAITLFFTKTETGREMWQKSMETMSAAWVWFTDVVSGGSLVDGIKKFLQISPGALTADFVKNINKGVKWLDAAAKIKYAGIMDWSATYIDQIKEWGKKKWEELIEWTEVDIWAWITTTTKSIWDWIVLTGISIWDWVTETAKSKSIWEWIVWTVTSVWDFVTWTVISIWDIIVWTKEHIFEWIFGSGSIADGMTKSIWDIIIWSKISIWEYVDKTTHSIWDWFTTETVTVWDWIKTSTKSIWSWFTTETVTVWDWIKTSTKSIWSWFTTETVKVWDWIKTSTKSIWSWFTTETVKVWDWIKTSTKSIWSWFTTETVKVWDWIKTGTKSIWDWITIPTVGLPSWTALFDWSYSLTDWLNAQLGLGGSPPPPPVEPETTRLEELMDTFDMNRSGGFDLSEWNVINQAYMNNAITSDDYNSLKPYKEFAEGGPVQQTGMALVHAGEYVIPKGGALVGSAATPAMDITINLTVNNGTQKDSRALADEISRILATEIRRMVTT